MRYVFKMLFLLVYLVPQHAAASELTISPEERFQDLFVTAGYSTAFGAALGAAFIGLSPKPAGKLRYLAMGASLGFIAGSVLGTYFVFAPAFAGSDERYISELSDDPYTLSLPDNTLTLRPVFSKDAIHSVQANWVVSNF